MPCSPQAGVDGNTNEITAFAPRYLGVKYRHDSSPFRYGRR
jgi:hypothetical protein